MQGEYAAEFEEALQRASEMAVQNVLDNPAVKGLMDALGEAYGIDVQSADNLAALTEAVKNGKVKNDEYYETLAAERGISVKTRGKWTGWKASCNGRTPRSSGPNRSGRRPSTSSVRRPCGPSGKRKRRS